MKLEPYAVEIRLGSLSLGVDNIHYDVYLSPRFVEHARRYLLDLTRQTANISLFYGTGMKPARPPETGAFRRILGELLQASLERAQFEKSIELDLLMRLALLKFLTQEISDQFSSLLVECKDRIRARGEMFEHSEQAHVMRSRIAELQADRKSVYRQVGQTLHRVLSELEEGTLLKSRRALFGDDFHETYELLTNRLLFVEGGADDYLHLEHYVLLANYVHDLDRFEIFEALLLDFIRDFVLADSNAEELSRARKTHERLVEQALAARSELTRLEEEEEDVLRRLGGGDDLFGWLRRDRAQEAPAAKPELVSLKKRRTALEQSLAGMAPELETAKLRLEFLNDEYQSRLGDYLNEPDNARRLFDPHGPEDEGDQTADTRSRLLDEWVSRLEERDLLVHVLAGYELVNLYRDYCPPVHLQQLKKALVVRDEARRVESILQQFPARNFSIKRLEEAARALRRCTPEIARATAQRFAADLMRMRRDRRNYQHVAAWMERLQLMHSEQTREVSRANHSLYEFLLPDEARPKEDAVVSHAIIKADVRGSTQMTKDLLARGLNPASHFSLNFYEPVKRLLVRHGAAKVFIEGDAIILAIYETESNRANQRAVAKACVLAREILAVTQSYNTRAHSDGLPRIELGLGVAFQNSAPSIWMDGDSRVMISRALNLSDRLASCSKVARRLIDKNPSPFRVFLLETVMEGADEDEGEELAVRYNLNGIKLNDEGFLKLSEEISLVPLEGNFPMPWGKEKVQLYFGEVPLGDSLEPLVIRKALARELLPGGKVGGAGKHTYYEVCTHPKLLELARKRVAALRKG